MVENEKGMDEVYGPVYQIISPEKDQKIQVEKQAEKSEIVNNKNPDKIKILTVDASTQTTKIKKRKQCCIMC